jgi:hypothetical protein
MSTSFAMLTVKNAVLYASSIYDNPGCVSIDEFMEDYTRFKYVKRLCRRYVSTKEITERLFLNHLIALVNVFGPEGTTRLLFVKCEDERLYRILKPFLLYLDILPDVVRGIDGFDIVTETIPSDAKITRRLREL